MNKRTTPIINFASEEDLLEITNEWTEALFLQNWIIRVVLITDKNDTRVGWVDRNLICKIATVSICTETEEDPNAEIKHCDELSLVHELLHLKYDILPPIPRDEFTLELHALHTLEHQLIEEMARSLIMVKYNLPFSWFVNNKKI